MEDNFEILNSEQGDIIISFENRTFKLSHLASLMRDVVLNNQLQDLNQKLSQSGSATLPSYKQYYWTDNGVSCEILKPGKVWQKGKARIKVTLEFRPDEPEIEAIPEINEPESPLDDLRRKINEATS